MGSFFDKLGDKLPDIYFDWYARLLPGCVGILFGYLCYSGKLPFSTKSESVILIVFLAYLLGHVIQPLSSGVIKAGECWFGLEAEFRRREKLVGQNLRKKRLVSKAHAEAVSSFSILILFIVISYFLGAPAYGKGCYFIWVIAALLIAAVERISARRRKIENLNDKDVVARS